ncbi:MAG: hypothetical protein OHK0028_06210 [Deltaproteobacteria bacterium]
MNRRIVKAFEAAAVLLAILMFVSVSGGAKSSRPAPSRGVAAASFHGGGSTAGAPGDAVCSGAKCHPSASHRKTGTVSAFLNFHEGIASCLACHARDAERVWRAPDSGIQGAPRLDALPGSAAGNPHAAIGSPLACERCHSPEGRRTIESAGVKNLVDGFESPVALRMIQGGGRKWVPEDMR